MEKKKAEWGVGPNQRTVAAKGHPKTAISVLFGGGGLGYMGLVAMVGSPNIRGVWKGCGRGLFGGNLV